MSKQKNFICSFKSMWKSKVYTTLGQHRVIGSWISAACVRWGPEKMRSRELPTQASGDWSHTQGHRWPVVQRPLSDLCTTRKWQHRKAETTDSLHFLFSFYCQIKSHSSILHVRSTIGCQNNVPFEGDWIVLYYATNVPIYKSELSKGSLLDF